MADVSKIKLPNGTELNIKDKTSGYVDSAGAASAAPVQSVNGNTGDVTVQPTLVSGTNIKTINNESLLGSGNIVISSGGTATDVQINGTSITSGGVANIPYATNNAAGVVSTTTQTFAGNKTYTGSVTATSLSVENGTGRLPEVKIGYSNVEYGSIYYDHTSGGQIGFEIYDENIEASSTYLLPTVAAGDVDGTSYNILTTKDYEDYVVTKSTQQNIPGLKWFSAGAVLAGNYEIKDTYNYSEFDFRDQTFTTSIETASGTRSAYIINSRDAVGSSLGNKMHFVIRSPKADGTGYASGHDIYKLPTPANGQTTNPEYDILTTKNTKTVTASLTTSGWTASNTQTVTVTGMTANAVIMVSAAPASEATYRHSGVYCSAQATNSLTFTCASVPTAAITVNILTIG